jgi:hypothetical protein
VIVALLTALFVLAVCAAILGAGIAWYSLDSPYGGPAEFVLGALLAVPTGIAALALYPLTVLPGLL